MTFTPHECICGHVLTPRKNAGRRRLSLLFCVAIPCFRWTVFRYIPPPAKAPQPVADEQTTPDTAVAKVLLDVARQVPDSTHPIFPISRVSYLIIYDPCQEVYSTRFHRVASAPAC